MSAAAPIISRPSARRSSITGPRRQTPSHRDALIERGDAVLARTREFVPGIGRPLGAIRPDNRRACLRQGPFLELCLFHHRMARASDGPGPKRADVMLACPSSSRAGRSAQRRTQGISPHPVPLPMGEGTLELSPRIILGSFSHGEKDRMRGGSVVHRGTEHPGTLTFRPQRI